jgi:hypothetical protein
MKQHYYIHEDELSLLSELPGMAVIGISTEECYHTLGKFAYTLGKSITIETEGPSILLRLDSKDENPLPVVGLLKLDKIPSPVGLPVNLSLPAWSVVSKVEVWAEKITTETELNTVIAENTLLIETESALRLLICPEHPEQALGLYCDEKEIENILGSGRYLLKHIID